MNSYRITVYGWGSDDNPRPVLLEQIIKADNLIDALNLADPIWRKTLKSVSYTVNKI
jgi:hypothetical protein